MTRKITMLLAAVAALLWVSSCKTQYDLILEGNSAEDKYKMAFELFENKKYAKAAEMFESLGLLTNGTAQDDTVQFYIGYSNYCYGDYTTAESNLQRFITTFPLSDFTHEAQFLRLDCLYKGTYRYELDQVPTKKAIVEMNNFKLDNPTSEYIPQIDEMLDDLNDRLELKAYKSAYLYYHMEDYLAAHYALKNVLKDNADNRYREEVLYYTAMSAYYYALNSVPSKQKERYLVFVDDYLNVVSEYPDSDYSKKLESYYTKVQKILKKDKQESNE